MFVLLAAAAATLTAPGPNSDNWPPIRFEGDRPNVRISFFDDQGHIDAHCGKAPPGFHHFGCSSQGGDWIVIVNPCTAPGDDDYARQLCHELGHLNGWPGDHPR